MNEKMLATHPSVAAYLEEVCSHVKAKDVHNDIVSELLGHLLERVEDLMELEQMGEEEAVASAVRGMGDAREVGIGLNAAHKPKTEWSVVVIFAVMFLLAVVALFAMPAGYINFTTKLVIVLAGLLFMVAAYFGNYQKLARWSWWLYAITIAVMYYSLLFGTQINGLKQWISIGPINVNLGEVSPYLLIVAIAGILYIDRTKSRSTQLMSSVKIMAQLVAFILLPMLAYMLTPTMINLAVYTFGIFVLLIVYGRWRFILAAAGTLITGMVLLLSFNGGQLHYIKFRLTAMFSNDPHANYQALRSVEAIQAGGLWGQGIGVPNPKLPFIYSEMMYAYLVYSLGWIFGTIVVLAVIAFVWRTIRMGLKTKDMYGRSLIVGVCSIFGIRLLWNLLMCLGIVPIFGIGLPILQLSSVTILEFGLIGFMLGVYRRKDMISQQQDQGFQSSLTKS